MVDGEIIQNVNAVATIKTGVIMIKRKKKIPFPKMDLSATEES